MNREDVIRMAMEAGFEPHDMSADFDCNLKDIERFAALVAAHEREACAKACEQLVGPYAEGVGSIRHTTHVCAAAIRERGQEPPR